VGISRDYPLKIRSSKQPIGEIPGYEIIPSHPLKYSISKQGLKDSGWVGPLCRIPSPFRFMFDIFLVSFFNFEYLFKTTHRL
jgi:hypothetical protein